MTLIIIGEKRQSNAEKCPPLQHRTCMKVLRKISYWNWNKKSYELKPV